MKKICALTLAVVICIVLLPATTVSATIDTASTWAHDGIIEAVSKGFVPEDLQHSFQSSITRAEFCRLAMMWLEYVTDKSVEDWLTGPSFQVRQGVFSDTDDPKIQNAFKLGITNGVIAPTNEKPGMFFPNAHFTREQAATMIANTVRVFGGRTLDFPWIELADRGEVSTWANWPVNFVYARSIMSGVSNNRFDPQGTFTREQSIIAFNNIGTDVTSSAFRQPRPNDSSSKLIALTFDDGPSMITYFILTKLEEHNVPATFFFQSIGEGQTGGMVPVAQRAHRLGHDIENHGYAHIDLAKVSREAALENINRTSNRIEEMIGIRPTFFRPAFFSTGPHMHNLVDLPFVFADVNPRDYVPNTSPRVIADRILSTAKDGSIILLHDNGPLWHLQNTIDSLDLFIPELLKQGYKFVTVRELYELRGIPLRPYDGHRVSTVR
jgi:peptidoglycan/xylan/chitin deacetylase (PgdA/CDA1 family)